ncbi:DMT family transporter [Allopusillimonas ginsengisoli]|uniref:DMT family transporter n=1 Tax=Allopusillimonas ginsengisoli TaxID=453575 RepID=UPI0010C1C2A4|nr:DMT family transporter [Allopusillimonas ginsengisoli]
MRAEAGVAGSDGKRARATVPGNAGVTRPLAGIVVLVLSTWALSGLDASGKWVMGGGVSLLMLCWVRYVVHLLLVLGLVLPVRGAAVLRSVRPRAQIVRGGVMLLATMSFFTTLHYLPQAEATAINFLAPLIVLSLAPWLLKEAARVSRWVAAGVGFAGVLIVIRPGAGLDPVGTLFGLLTACLFAGQFLATRKVAIDNPFTTLIWSGGVGSVCLTLALPFILPDALPILAQLDAWQWVILISTGFWGALGHLLQIQAYRHAAASLLAPFVYLQIVSAAVLGWWVWGQFPDALSWLGIGIICASGITIGMVEWRRRNL